MGSYNGIKSATMALLRDNGNGLETLLVRRAHLNALKENRPMIWGGEWVFPGGKSDQQDTDTLATAVREMREETGYQGELRDVSFISRYEAIAGKKRFSTYFYGGFPVDSRDEAYLVLPNQTEIIDIAWKKPQEWLELLASSEFSAEQEKAIKELGLSNPAHGDFRVVGRHFPYQTIIALGYLQDLAKERSS